MSQLRALTAGLDWIEAALTTRKRVEESAKEVSCADCGRKMTCVCSDSYGSFEHTHYVPSDSVRCHSCSLIFQEAWRKNAESGRDPA